jgi:hypothetical protein
MCKVHNKTQVVYDSIQIFVICFALQSVIWTSTDKLNPFSITFYSNEHDLVLEMPFYESLKITQWRKYHSLFSKYTMLSNRKDAIEHLTFLYLLKKIYVTKNSVRHKWHSFNYINSKWIV